MRAEPRQQRSSEAPRPPRVQALRSFCATAKRFVPTGGMTIVLLRRPLLVLSIQRWSAWWCTRGGQWRAVVGRA